jgi:hypothetical protein
MEIVYFTLVAVILYLGADWILNRIEAAAGQRLKYRNIVFFVMLLAMALSSFALINRFSVQQPSSGLVPNGAEVSQGADG